MKTTSAWQPFMFFTMFDVVTHGSELFMCTNAGETGGNYGPALIGEMPTEERPILGAARFVHVRMTPHGFVADGARDSISVEVKIDE